MKIIITVGTYYPLSDGVQAVTGYLAEGMAQKGNNVIVLTRCFPGMKEKEYHNGVEIRRYKVDTVHAVHRGNIRDYQKAVLELSNSADAIICVCPQIVTTDALLPVLKDIRCKKILYMHGMHNFSIKKFEIETVSLLTHKIWNQIRWAWLYYGHKEWFKQFDEIIQIHRLDGTYEFIKKHYGIKSKIIENAADNIFFEEKDCKIQIQGRYIINVANFIPSKNQESILEAFYRSNTDMKLVLIGSSETPYYKKIVELNEQLKKKYADKEVIIMIGVPRNEIATYVNKSSLYIMNSRWEVFPISLIESMASGTPFISSDVGVARFLAGGVIANSIEEMEYWIDLFSDNPDLMSKLGKVGKEYAEKNLRIESKVEKLLEIIRE